MAKQMIYTARNIKADEAYRIGLVNAVYPQEELMAAAEKMAAGIAKERAISVVQEQTACAAAFKRERMISYTGRCHLLVLSDNLSAYPAVRASPRSLH